MLGLKKAFAEDIDRVTDDAEAVGSMKLFRLPYDPCWRGVAASLCIPNVESGSSLRRYFWL